MLSEREIDLYRRAGNVVSHLRKFAQTIVREGSSIAEICETIENKTAALGAKPAFPVNVGLNHVAAHYTSPVRDTAIIPPMAIVKLDFGVQYDGFLTDSAITVCLNPNYYSMVTAAEEALNIAIQAIRPGLKIGDVGAMIQKSIENYGYRPISNLMGHKIERYTIHAGKSVPNVAGLGEGSFQAGEVYAVEPFVTLRTSAGKVADARQAFIYRLIKNKGLKNRSARELVSFIKTSYHTLPFAERWLQGFFPDLKRDEALREALDARCLMAYPVLVEVSGGPVAQAEHTVLVTKNGCEVLTL